MCYFFVLRVIMNWYWIKTNSMIKRVFSNYIWEIPAVDKKVYLTFDDGPTPEITTWVLNQLKQYGAQATFFCIGENIHKNPNIFESIIQNGHAVGNHTYNHYNGWKTKTADYIENVFLCEELINQNTKLFRPPYGKIKKSQAKILLDLGFKIIMWDVLSADFDATISTEKCLNNVLRNISPGSIIVFHDSTKAFKNLEYALPRTLQFLKDNDYKCEGIV
jgi:peptidoglycan/xylan/chitin deacetylase (PgdA/CDA1 family)